MESTFRTTESTINVEIDGYKRPIETLGSGVHELFLLASQVVLNEGRTILLEEPETHMHPEFQRKLLEFFRDKIDSQFFITTHSAAIIDTDDARVFGVTVTDGRARIEPLLRDQRRREVCLDLGHKASDLLQSNCVVWVEGPSDRIYVRYWLEKSDSELREGIEYSIMYYGGRLLKNLSASDSEVEEFISLLPINRFPAILLDGDRGSSAQNLNATKTRILEEIASCGGFSWVTAGREIENYVPFEVRERAVQVAHPASRGLSGARNRFAKPLNYFNADRTEQKTGFDKMRIARCAVDEGFELSELDVAHQIENLVRFIRRANRLS